MAPFRYRKPGYLALNVTDLDRSVAFYRDLVGLEVEAEAEGVACLRCSDDHHNLVLYRAGEAGFKRMAFQLESEGDLDAARAHVARLGIGVREVPADEREALRQGPSFRFTVPDSTLTFEFYATIACAAAPFVPRLAKIQRLGHVVVALKNRDAVLRTLTEQLNFRVSDHFGDQVSFLRCFPNPYHHSFGVARADEDRFHHVNFMVSDVDDVGRGMNRMKKNGVEIVYGPGRHDISNSIFLYFLDPDGLTAEYSFGMEEFAEEGAREARMLPLKPEVLDSWGGLPAPNFAKRGGIEKAEA